MKASKFYGPCNCGDCKLNIKAGDGFMILAGHETPDMFEGLPSLETNPNEDFIDLPLFNQEAQRSEQMSLFATA